LGHQTFIEGLTQSNAIKFITQLKFKKYEGMSGENSIGFFYEDDGCILVYQKSD
jgi:hypothetical protein